MYCSLLYIVLYHSESKCKQLIYYQLFIIVISNLHCKHVFKSIIKKEKSFMHIIFWVILYTCIILLNYVIVII